MRGFGNTGLYQPMCIGRDAWYHRIWDEWNYKKGLFDLKVKQTILYHTKLISQFVKDSGLPRDAVPEARQQTEEARSL